MRFYYSAGRCSMGIRIVLEEIGHPFEAVALDVLGGETQRSPFIDLNPKGKVPTLERDDGSVITEYPVIARYLAQAYPGAGLLPTDDDAELRGAEAMEYAVSTIHMTGCTRIARPELFSPNEAEHDAVRARGNEMVEKGYRVLAQQLAGKEWIAGSYGVADSAVFYVSYWALRCLG